MTARETRFVAEYLVDGNATQAAIRAGYSRRTARSIGSENLTKPDVAAAIEAGQQRVLAQVGIDAQDILRRNATIINFDPAELVDEGGNYLPLSKIPVEARRCIKRIRVHKQNLTAGDGKVDTVIDYEFMDRDAALNRDYKRLGHAKERVEHDGKLEIQWQS